MANKLGNGLLQFYYMWYRSLKWFLYKIIYRDDIVCFYSLAYISNNYINVKICV